MRIALLYCGENACDVVHRSLPLEDPLIEEMVTRTEKRCERLAGPVPGGRDRCTSPRRKGQGRRPEPASSRKSGPSRTARVVRNLVDFFCTSKVANRSDPNQ